MKPVRIHDEYLNASKDLPLPPELTSQESQINHLVRRGLEYYGWSDPQQSGPRGPNAGLDEAEHPESASVPNL
jgi:hypothetical protein